jgi:hypothetical protein
VDAADRCSIYRVGGGSETLVLQEVEKFITHSIRCYSDRWPLEKYR